MIGGWSSKKTRKPCLSLLSLSACTLDWKGRYFLNAVKQWLEVTWLMATCHSELDDFKMRETDEIERKEQMTRERNKTTRRLVDCVDIITSYSTADSFEKWSKVGIIRYNINVTNGVP